MAAHETGSAGKRRDIARRIADELAGSGVRLVASLPDNWISELIREIDGDQRFQHVPVNREESAIGLCAGAYMGGARLGRADGRVRPHDGDLCHHQDQLFLRDPAADADHAARRRSATTTSITCRTGSISCR